MADLDRDPYKLFQRSIESRSLSPHFILDKARTRPATSLVPGLLPSRGLIRLKRKPSLTKIQRLLGDQLPLATDRPPREFSKQSPLFEHRLKDSIVPLEVGVSSNILGTQSRQSLEAQIFGRKEKNGHCNRQDPCSITARQYETDLTSDFDLKHMSAQAEKPKAYETYTLQSEPSTQRTPLREIRSKPTSVNFKTEPDDKPPQIPKFKVEENLLNIAKPYVEENKSICKSGRNSEDKSSIQFVFGRNCDKRVLASSISKKDRPKCSCNQDDLSNKALTQSIQRSLRQKKSTEIFSFNEHQGIPLILKKTEDHKHQKRLLFQNQRNLGYFPDSLKSILKRRLISKLSPLYATKKKKVSFSELDI